LGAAAAAPAAVMVAFLPLVVGPDKKTMSKNL
jgi:hypothetical protein